MKLLWHSLAEATAPVECLVWNFCTSESGTTRLGKEISNGSSILIWKFWTSENGTTKTEKKISRAKS